VPSIFAFIELPLSRKVDVKPLRLTDHCYGRVTRLDVQEPIFFAAVIQDRAGT